MTGQRPLTDLALMVLLALAIASIAWHVASAGRTREWKPTPGELVCPDPRAPLDADGCPSGVWGFQRTAETPPDLEGRVAVCAEIRRLCAE